MAAYKSTIVEIIRAYQPHFIVRLLRCRSTIVEIIRAYQPFSSCHPPISDLQQQKLLELTSPALLNTFTLLSTIVEIIRAYQPIIFQALILYLQQQKLLELTSLASSGCTRARSTIVEIIRAYQPIIAPNISAIISTIVEIIRAYQPGTRLDRCISSTIVEIIRAYQPKTLDCVDSNDLQQQKLLEPTSPVHRERRLFRIYNSRNYQSLLAKYLGTQRDSIYNSRNYQSLLACIDRGRGRNVSTIVEIIRAYQPAYLL